MEASQQANDIGTSQRFAFGENWMRLLNVIDENRVAAAMSSLRGMLGVESLAGRSVLDIGSGSGLFSLAAIRLGAARVYSFDYDPQSVACTTELRRRFFAGDERWIVTRGSVLDPPYMESLGLFDVVYSWGVLHHTGAMWDAIEAAAARVRPGGQLFIAIYNDQGVVSRYWRAVKRLYNQSRMGRIAVIALHAPYLVGGSLLVRAATGRLRLDRGMSVWYDLIDWLGGYPFEVATPIAVTTFCTERGFRLSHSVTTRRLGCNQFVFTRRMTNSDTEYAK